MSKENLRSTRPNGGAAIASTSDPPLPQHQDHPRDWRENFYVYPVISRRSGGLSIGINLNPDTACNFDCVYCQVDRSGEPRVRDVDLTRLRDELSRLIDEARSGSLFNDPAFADVPPGLRPIKDIAFSGDGEPTTCDKLGACVDLVASLKRQAGLSETRIVLITNACYLNRPQVQGALALMDRNDGDIWAKLDAGTEAYYRKVNRPNVPLTQVVANIIDAASVRPIVIQSIFMGLYGTGPDDAELLAYTDRLHEITAAGGRISYIQVYTIARVPAQAYATGLPDTEVDRIAEWVRTRTGLQVRAFHGAG